MVSAVVLAWDAGGRNASPEAVVRTLAALVPAAIDGLVRDVTLAGCDGQDLGQIADHAGCALVQAATPAEAWTTALGLTREPLVLVMQAGALPDAGYVDEITSHLLEARAPSKALVAVFEARSRLDFWPKPAVLLSTKQHLATVRSGQLVDMVKAAKPRLVLRSRARKVVSGA